MRRNLGEAEKGDRQGASREGERDPRRGGCAGGSVSPSRLPPAPLPLAGQALRLTCLSLAGTLHY